MIALPLPHGFLEVDLEWFFEALLPSVSEDSVSAIVALLHGKLEGGTSESYRQPYPASIVRGRWRWYKKDPKDMSESGVDDTVFARFNDLYTVITEAARTVLGLETSAGTRDMPQPSRRGKVSKKNPCGHYDFDSVASWQFRKTGDDEVVTKDHEQFWTDVASLMFSDPIRRFRLGITIENTSTRLWFLSRAQCFVSKPFNFTTDHHPLVHFFASAAIASHDELGYDPSVRKITVEQPVQTSTSLQDAKACAEQTAYEYMIRDGDEEIWYQTINKALFSYQESCLLGRAVRVWKVRRVAIDSTGERTLVGPVMALKDYWLAKNARTEGEIQEDMFRRAREARVRRSEAADHPEDVQKHFMTIVHDVPVELQNGHFDTSEEFIRCPLPQDCQHTSLLLPPGRQATAPHGTSHNTLAKGTVANTACSASDYPKQHRVVEYVFEHRIHHRLVFKEVGVPLQELTDSSMLFKCLADATKGLKVLHDAEYVHRDVSTGNLLLCETEEGLVCKISDLEYTHPQSTYLKEGEGAHDRKTGTPYFMSIEIQRNYYMFAPADLEEEVKIPPFLHNYMHDVEGLWWIAMWFLFFTIPISRIEEIKLNQMLPQEITAQDIFSLSLTGSYLRSEVLERRSAYDMRVSDISSEFAHVVALMGDAASLIRKCYLNNQRATTLGHVNTPEPYAHIYEPLARLFREAASLAPKDVRHMSSVRATLAEKAEDSAEDNAAPPLGEKEAAEEKNGTMAARSTHRAQGIVRGKRTAENIFTDMSEARPNKRAKKAIFLRPLSLINLKN